MLRERAKITFEAACRVAACVLSRVVQQPEKKKEHVKTILMVVLKKQVSIQS